ncbi:hypothetical protein CDL12_06909 [Handroanthus impetiginosus]|uniref:Bifunctional inhibitor/plant lipid transfer protein/seed storage helical domain-containing protein n=1 Tax=Handroanthus impetiginosus TaxID=429701 RepID=A0A2G9HSB6_9LAMI|nr:hypothetical protein CDL12_06909 [Handroanthus impetiginosus]
MKELRFCLNYLNSSSQPPKRCCQPLDYVVKSIPECLCSLMSTLGVTQVEQLVGVNASKILALPGRCGQQNDSVGCNTGTNPQSTNSTPNSTSFGLWSSSLIMVVASSIFLILWAI